MTKRVKNEKNEIMLNERGFKVTWSKGPDAKSYIVKRYIGVKSDATIGQENISISGDTVTCKDTDSRLQHDKKYKYKIWAVNDKGQKSTVNTTENAGPAPYPSMVENISYEITTKKETKTLPSEKTISTLKKAFQKNPSQVIKLIAENNLNELVKIIAQILNLGPNDSVKLTKRLKPAPHNDIVDIVATLRQIKDNDLLQNNDIVKQIMQMKDYSIKITTTKDIMEFSWSASKNATYYTFETINSEKESTQATNETHISIDLDKISPPCVATIVAHNAWLKTSSKCFSI